MHPVLLWCALLCGAFQVTSSLNIVFIGVIATPSHFLWTDTLLTELLSRGHRITEFTFKQPAPHPNRTTFVSEKGLFSHDLFKALIDSTRRNDNLLFKIYDFSTKIVEDFRTNLATKAFQDMKKHLTINQEKVDLLIVDHGHREGLIAISQLIGYPPVVAITAYNHPASFNSMMGNPQLPALVPHDLSSFTCEMTFSERASNFLAHSFSRLVEYFYYEPALEKLMRETISPDSPSLYELEKNISVALVNTHPTTHCQQSYTESVVEVGFLHIKPPKELPKDIKKFLDEAVNGAVLVSFGSSLSPDRFPGLQEELVEVFKKIQKLRFLWKSPNPPKDLPPNVLVSQWLPQSDALAHPNIRLLVSHGGTLSTQEAIYRGVPLITVPFFLDQGANANRIVSLGVGRSIKSDEITSEALIEDITSILENVTYKERMSQLSAIAQDQPESALERAVFWVEFVGRHKGAPHLRNDSRQMTWFQYYAIDVITVLTLGLLSATAITTLFIRFVMSQLFFSKRKVKIQ